MYTSKALETEKTLITELIAYLEQEIEYVVSGNVETLEESMPQKMQILKAIADNRTAPENNPPDLDHGEAEKVRALKNDLGKLWKKAGGLNETSKEMIGRRLNDIEIRLEPFFTSLKTGYDRGGKSSKHVAHTIKSGV